MAHNRELSENPLVSLEADKLLGMRQVAKVSTWGADGASRDPGGSAGGAADSRAGASRLLSKIGPEIGKIGVGETDKAAASREEMSRMLSKIGGEIPPLAEASKLLSKIGVGEMERAAVSREEMSRLLSKIGDAEMDGPAVSREEMSRLLSKISEFPIR